MSSKLKSLEEKLERLTIALSRLSKDKKDARKTLITDIKQVQSEIETLKKAPTKTKSPVSLTTIIILSILLAVTVGVASYFLGGQGL